MDKVATLRALLSSTEIAFLQHDDIDCRLAFIPFRGASEPVLIFELSQLVGWLRMEGDNAIWRYGNMLTGSTSMPRTLANPLSAEGRAVSKAVYDACSEIMPLWPPAGTEDGEPERFAASIEAGAAPAAWSAAIEAAPQVAAEAIPTVPAPVKVAQDFPPPSAATPAAGSPSPPSDSPFETKFNPYRHDKTRYPAAPGYSEQQLDGRILETVHPAVAPAVIGGVALFVAVLPMPYEFYVLLRWAVPAMAIWMCTLASGQKRTGWVVVFTLIAILWNPLVPFQMPRGAWVFPDLAGAALFAAAGASLKASKPALRLNHPSSL